MNCYSHHARHAWRVVHADAIRRVVREALNEGNERRSISGDVDRMAERNSIDTDDSLENDYLSWY